MKYLAAIAFGTAIMLVFWWLGIDADDAQLTSGLESCDADNMTWLFGASDTKLPIKGTLVVTPVNKPKTVSIPWRRV